MVSKFKRGFILFLGFTAVYFFVFIFSVISSGVSDNLDLGSWMYFFIAALGHSALFSFILFVIFYIPFSLIFKKSTIASVIYLTASVVFQLILIIDSLVFNIYKFHINGFVIEMLLKGGADEVFVFDTNLYIKFLGVIFLGAIIPAIIIYQLSKKGMGLIKSKFNILISLFLLLCIVFSHLGYAFARAVNNQGIQKSATVLPLYFPLTANTLLREWGMIDDKEINIQAYNKTSSDIQYPLKPLEITDSIPNYNVVYILMDSWNPSTFDSIVSPQIFKFSEKGQFFSNHYSSNNGTRGSIFGLFFGLSFTYENEFNMSKMSPLIVDRMIESNYDINVFPSATFTNPPFNEIVYRRVPNITLNTEGSTSFDRDQKITNDFIDFLDTREKNKPFFSFIFYDLPHAITLPKEYIKKFPSDWDSPDYLALNNNMDRTPFFDLYKSCIYRTDALIGELLNKMENQGLLDNTIVIITGDHGQEFNENKKNYWGHGSDYSKWQIQVPFIIYYPEIEPNKRYPHMTTHYDISPTILNRFFGVQNDSRDYSMGYDLWDNSTRYPHIVGDHVNYAFVLEDMILKTDHIGSLEITDLSLNPLSRDAIDVKSIQKAIEKKNKFYK